MSAFLSTYTQTSPQFLRNRFEFLHTFLSIGELFHLMRCRQEIWHGLSREYCSSQCYSPRKCSDRTTIGYILHANWPNKIRTFYGNFFISEVYIAAAYFYKLVVFEALFIQLNTFMAVVVGVCHFRFLTLTLHIIHLQKLTFFYIITHQVIYIPVKISTSYKYLNCQTDNWTFRTIHENC